MPRAVALSLRRHPQIGPEWRDIIGGPRKKQDLIWKSNKARTGLPDLLIRVAFADDLAVDLPCLFVSLLCLRALLPGNLGPFLAPALIHGLQTPLGAAA